MTETILTPERMINGMTEAENEKYQRAYDLVYDFLNGNRGKTAMWFEVPNPAFGGMSGKQMIMSGRIDKLLKFIENAIAEN